MYSLNIGDSLEFMKSMKDGSVSATITDPPYGIGADANPIRGKSPHHKTNWDVAIPKSEYFSEIFRVSKKVCIWGGNYFTEFLPPRMGWIVWDKGQREFSLADFELCWTSENKAGRIVNHPRSKSPAEGNFHPTQKPLKVIYKCIQFLGLKEGDTVLDPFMGSASTGIACLKMNINFIGVERDPVYFEIAKKRVEQAVLQPSLLTPANTASSGRLDSSAQQALFSAGEVLPAKSRGATRRR